MPAEILCILAKVDLRLNTVYGPSVIYSLRYYFVAEASYYRSGFTWNNLVQGCSNVSLAMIISLPLGGVGRFICGSSGIVEDSY